MALADRLAAPAESLLVELLESLATGSEPVEPTPRNALAGIRARPSAALRTLPLQAADELGLGRDLVVSIDRLAAFIPTGHGRAAAASGRFPAAI